MQLKREFAKGVQPSARQVCEGKVLNKIKMKVKKQNNFKVKENSRYPGTVESPQWNKHEKL